MAFMKNLKAEFGYGQPKLWCLPKITLYSC